MELIGKVLAKRYTIVEKLGHGGYGDVYRAFDANLQLDVVVKKLKDLRKSENGGREEVDVLKQRDRIWRKFERSIRDLTKSRYCTGLSNWQEHWHIYIPENRV